ncbi:MAG TPA: DNA primase [Burkholderiales bacterium]|nr:DNA primase [Burkholderiales bacterium]
MIPQSFIQDLLHRVDIVDVIDRYVKLKRAGANFAACCPFHSEKSPSFTVSPTKQFYHCFGCGAHGTAISFLMEYSGLGFVEAVKDLAQNLGMAVPEERGEQQSGLMQRRRAEGEDGEDLTEIMLIAAQFYRGALKEAPQAIDYLKKRGLSGDIAKKFGVGYAPEGWQNLERAFSNYQAGTLTTVGLVKQNDEGRRYDIFRDRIMFPIVDVRGNVIGFGGRVLDAGEPKYLNSPETPLFEKGRELYGLYQARRAIRDAGRVIVVEGYMDVVALAQHGVEYAVATLGTATTPMHVQKLLRQTDEIVYCFDGDNAGRRAAWRALENSLGQLADGKQVRFLFLPQGEDPDSYVRQHGKENFEKLLNEAIPLSQFMINTLSLQVDRNTSEGRARLLQEAKPLIKEISAPMLSLMLRKQLAELAGFTLQELDAEFQIKSYVKAAPQHPKREAAVAQPLRLLMLLLGNMALCKKISEFQVGLLAESPDYAPVLEVIRFVENYDQASVAAFLEATRDSPYESMFREAQSRILTDVMDADAAELDIQSIFRNIEIQKVTTEYEQLMGKTLRTEEDKAQWRALDRRLAEFKGVVVTERGGSK